MRKRLLILGLMAVLVVAGSAPSFAARPVNGTIGDVSASDGALLAGQVGFRVYSAMPGGESNINDNTSSCRNVRCLRNYSTNALLTPGGFIAPSEATNAYNGDAPDQAYYYLADACPNNDLPGHLGWFAVGGVRGNNSGVGNHFSTGCPSTTTTNCFIRADSNLAGPDLTNTYNGYPAGGHSIRAIGGLNPIPTVRARVGAANGCPPGLACLSWNDPPDYAAAMRPSSTGGAPPSPVEGVNLYRHDSLGNCVEPAGSDPGWVQIGSFGATAGAVGTPVPLPGSGICSFFALRVRVTGPGSAGTLETHCLGGNSQPIAGPQTAVRIVRFNATYAGRGVVNVAWTSGIEGDVSGFYVTRSTTANGPFARVSDLVPAKGDNSNYTQADRVGTGAGRVYYYQLQVISRDGNVTTSSPAAVTLPGRSKKAGPSIR